MHGALTSLWSLPTDGDQHVHDQVFLPRRHGGMDYVAPDSTRCRAAYCSAAALTVKALAAAHPRLQVLDPAAAHPIHDAWASLCARAGEACELPDDFAAAVRSGDAEDAQCTVSRWLDDQAGAALPDQAASGREEVPALQHRARVRSCASVPGSAWVAALPAGPGLTMADPVFESAVHFRLGLSLLPSDAVHARCLCGKQLDAAHMMGCPKLSKYVRVRHDLLAAAWRRILQRAGIASSIEPLLHLLCRPGVDMRQADARGDILAILRAVTALDISVTHPACAGTCDASFRALRRAAGEDGHAAQARDEAKRRKYADNNFREQFVPLSHETYGRLGKPAMALLSDLGDIVAGAGRSSKSAFMNRALAELSVALQKGNEEVFRMYRFNFAKVSGHDFVPGDVVPSALMD